MEEAGRHLNNRVCPRPLRNLEIIGEASKHFPKRIKKRYSDIDWKAIVGMRNVVVHEYFGVNLEILWKTIRSRLPELKAGMEEILGEAEDKGKGGWLGGTEIN